MLEEKGIRVVTVAPLLATDSVDVDKDSVASRLSCLHDMGIVGFLMVPKDFVRDTLLRATLLDKCCVPWPRRAWQFSGPAL